MSQMTLKHCLDIHFREKFIESRLWLWSRANHLNSFLISISVCVCVCVCMCVFSCPCPTIYNPPDCGQPSSSVRGVFQARILEWVAISSSRGSSWPRDRTRVSCIASRLFTTETLEKPLNKQYFSLIVLIRPKFLLLDSHGIAVLSDGFIVGYKQASMSLENHLSFRLFAQLMWEGPEHN